MAKAKRADVREETVILGHKGPTMGTNMTEDHRGQIMTSKLLWFPSNEKP